MRARWWERSPRERALRPLRAVHLSRATAAARPRGPTPANGDASAWPAIITIDRAAIIELPGRIPLEITLPDSAADEKSAGRQLRLLVVDDHEVVRQGLVALLDRREAFQVVAEAGTVAESIEAARRFRPDIVVMDVRLPDGSGIEACREIRAEFPETRVVMLTSYPDDEAVLSAIVAGASGYLLKQVRARDLVAALEAVGRGESLLDPAVTEKVLERVRRIASGTYQDELSQLTSQEQKILALVAEGMTNKEIASEVFLSDKTVKNYVSSILSKLNLERRAQAAAFVAKHRSDHPT
jgi:two-component system, NarL family, response regulator DevR